MNESELKIKLSFITGLEEIVLKEIKQYPNLHVIRKDADSFYLDSVDNLTEVKHLRSISRAYVVVENSKYNPLYISNHKSIIGNLIDVVLGRDGDIFQTFKITCAGSDSTEVRSIAKYIQETYNLVKKEEADLKIHIIKLGEGRETGIQITPRPLSFRIYKVKNMSGAMDPTIAFAVNSLCELKKVKSYLNIFSGSATLLTEAGQCYPNLEKLIGFDNDKKRISLAMQNVRKASLIKRVQLKEYDIFDKPNLGKFDVITSDLPFGMSISKNENLEKLYQCFISYSEETLNVGGKLVVYTSEHELLRNIILKSKFKIIKTLELKFITSVNAYLRPQIFVCEFK
jgi:23S rRNA G2445 N2-methylase RlmL